MAITLYDYWRSSAAYRVRIGLNIKAAAYHSESISLHPRDNAHRAAPYREKNPQMRLPAIDIDGETVGQSLAILEWIEETYPDGPSLFPSRATARLKARAFAQTIACDIHPLNNPSVLNVLRDEYDASPEAISSWYADWIHRGFAALETRYGATRDGAFLFGDAPTIAEICLVPQIYNARRFEVPLEAYPNLVAVDAACQNIPAFAAAAPEQVKPSDI